MIFNGVTLSKATHRPLQSGLSLSIWGGLRFILLEEANSLDLLKEPEQVNRHSPHKGIYPTSP